MFLNIANSMISKIIKSNYFSSKLRTKKSFLSLITLLIIAVITSTACYSNKPIKKSHSTPPAKTSSKCKHVYTIKNKRYCVIHSARGFKQRGTASWYGPGFHGKKMANGEKYNMHTMTAAHKTLPLGTKLKVRNVKNGKTIIVTVKDRGPFHGNRIIDLSYKAAKQLDIAAQGTGLVEIRAI